MILSIGAPPILIFWGKNMNNDIEEKNKKENPDEDEDLRRFLRGGFGAKWAWSGKTAYLKGLNIHASYLDNEY